MSAFQVLTETNAVSVAILNVKIAATVGLVADITRDLHALRLEFSIERISIVDPNVGVPRPALRINDMIGAHRSSGFELSQHDDDAVALDHTKRRGVVPETQRRRHHVGSARNRWSRSEEHTSELQSRPHLVCRLLLE